MVGVKLLVFVVLGCVLGLLPVRVVDGVTLRSGAVQSKSFDSFFEEQDTVFVRFAQLYFNRSREEYTRYFPSWAQLKSNALAWVAVTGTNITKFTECASYAEQQSAMMFKYVGTKCSLSNVRLSRSSSKCRRRSRSAFFVRTCEEPKVTTVTVVAEPKTLLVSWSVQDRCSISKKYKVSWSNGSFVTSNNSVLSHRISGLPVSYTESVTVVALSSAGTAYRKGKTTSGTTGTLAGPVVTNVVVTSYVIGTVDVTWDLNDTNSLATDQLVAYSSGGTVSGSRIVSGTATTVSFTPSTCSNLTVSVIPRDASGNNLASSSTAQHSACTCGFVDFFSGCLFVSKVADKRSAAAAYCSGLNPEAKLVTVSSAAQFAALRAYISENDPEPNMPYYWMDLEASGGVWRWRGGYVQTTALNNVDWNSGEPDPTKPYAGIDGDSSYKLVSQLSYSVLSAVCYY